MPSESAKLAMGSELRKLRKLPGRLDAAKLTNARMLIKGFGGDDPDVALERLLNLVNENRGDREIQAAMASFGWGVDGETVLERLEQIASSYFVDTRTVRRWTDAGILRLSLLVLGRSPWVQPRIQQIISASPLGIVLTVRVAVPRSLWMNAPLLRVRGEALDLGIPPMQEASDQLNRSSPKVQLAIGIEPVQLRLQWTGEKQASYESVVQGGMGLEVSSRIVFHEMITYVQLVT